MIYELRYAYLRDERYDLVSEGEVKMVRGLEGEKVVLGREVVRFSEEEGRDRVRGENMGVVEGVFKVKLHWSVYGEEKRREERVLRESEEVRHG